MSETRVYREANNTLHIAEVARRRRTYSMWRWVIIGLVAIPVLIGLLDIIMRAAPMWASTEAAAAAISVQDLGASTAASDTYAAGSIIPARLKIPSIGVDAPVQRLGLNAEGAMQAPSSFANVGWYQDGAMPGAQGSAVFDGHVNNALTKAGVFEHLSQVREGDLIEVLDAAGMAVTYTVSAVRKYPVESAPKEEIFSRAGPPQLALITCDGVWDEAKHQFTDRLVVYATLAR